MSRKYPDEIVVDTKPLLQGLAQLHMDLTGSSIVARRYDEKKRRVLLYFLSSRKKIWITPQVLAEITTSMKEKVFEFFSSTLISNNVFKEFNEAYVKKGELITTGKIPKFGFTDMSISVFAKKQNRTLLTSDLALFNYCRSIGINVIYEDEVYTSDFYQA